ncbi:hypothetical protein DMN77_12700 [Paenibacillus sp. 79R4]|nr:hypothetical protein [Paenibacillus sp. 79R4]
MTPMIHRTFKQGDLVLIAVILSIALLILGARWVLGSSEATVNPTGNYHATIKVDNKIYKTVELTAETQYVEVQTSRGYDRLKIHDYGIEVIESDCPQKICFTFGQITKPGDVIICLPLRMIIEIGGQAPDSQTEIDAEVY